MAVEVIENGKKLNLELPRVKRNVAKMVGQGATEQEVETYISGEGVTAGQLRSVGKDLPDEERVMYDPAQYSPSFLKAKKGAGMAERFGRGVLGGLGRAGEGAIQAVGSVTGQEDVVKRSADITKGIGAGVEQLGTAGKVGEFVGEVAPIAAGTARILPQSLIAGGAVGGGLSGFLSPEEEAVGIEQRRDMAAIGAAGGAATGGLLKVAGKGLKGAREAAREITGKNLDIESARELAEQGIDVTAATAGGALVKDYMRRFLSSSFFGREAVGKSAERVSGQIDDALENTLRRVGESRGSIAEAGEEVREGLNKAKQDFKELSRIKSDAVNRKIPSDVQASIDETRSILQKTRDELTGTDVDVAIRSAQRKGREEIESIVEAISNQAESGNFSVKALNLARMRVGSMLSETPFSDPRQGAIKNLYRAISKDLDKSLDNLPTGARKELKQFNEFYKGEINTLQRLERKFGSTKSSEQAFDAMFSASTKDTKALGDMLSRMEPAAADSMRATLIQRLGKVARDRNMQDASSIRKLVTNYNYLSPETKSILFKSKANIEEADKLARNYSRVADLVQFVPETGMKGGATLGDILAAGSVFGGAISPALLIGGLLKFGSDRALSNLWTNPQSLKIINNAMQENAKKPVIKRAARLLVKPANERDEALLERAIEASVGRATPGIAEE